MTSARRPLPTDIVALVTFDGRIYPNEARPLDRLGVEDRTHPLETALEQWFSFATQKHTWISVRGATIRGLLSARPRAKRSAWEIEVLINAAEEEGVALSLFTRMTAAITRLGAERVFLRLEAGSSLLHTARCGGFFAYSQERLYRRKGGRAVKPAQGRLRPRGKHDALGIYELYRRTAPATVRAIEGATFREWQAAQEKWSGRTVDILEEEDGLVRRWLRVSGGQVGRLAILAESGNAAPVRETLDVALSRLAQSSQILALTPHYAPAVVAALEDAGFEAAGDFVTLAKRLAKPAEELVQEATGKALPVS
jgi:hypothetical protein